MFVFATWATAAPLHASGVWGLVGHAGVGAEVPLAAGFRLCVGVVGSLGG